MNIYLISQDENDDYETYDSAVVAAESEADARSISPDGAECEIKGISWVWTNQAYVTARFIGIAGIGINRGVICSSFNAG